MVNDKKGSKIIYRLDGEDRITSIEGDWLEFAALNGGQGLEISNVLGRHIRRFIADQRTLDFFLMIINDVRLKGRDVTIPYRCDAPDKRRFMEFTAKPRPGGGVECVSTTTLVQPRACQAVLARERCCSDAFLTVCSWCNKVKIDHEEWAEIEEAVERGEIDMQDEVPLLTHGICPGCVKTVKASLGC